MNLISLSSNNLCLNRAKLGFTLIEVMIALFILVMIGTTTSKAVIDAAKLKEVLKDETDFASEFRTGFAFIERDLNQVFNPRWFLPADLKPLDPFNQTQASAASTSGTSSAGAGAPTKPPVLSIEEITRRTKGAGFQTFDYWGPILDPSGIRSSRFQGKDSSMSFVSASHTRIYQQKRESIYAKVRYELIKQPSNPNLTKEQNDKYSSLQALVKVENTRAFELEDQKDSPYVNRYVILNYIKKIKFSYFKRDDKEAKREWDSEGSETKGIFPSAVQVEVTLVGPKDRTLDATVLFNLETPNDLLPKTY